MLKNYWRIAWRNLMKNKIFSFINIIGLSAGLACCMLITLYLLKELHYDRQHRNIEELYQLNTSFIQAHQEHPWATTPAPMAEAVKREFPEVLEVTRLAPLFQEDKTLLQYNRPGIPTVSFYESDGILADPTFFRIFTYHFTEGDPASALNNPLTLVLSEEIAKKLFGNEPALGKLVHISSSTNGDHDFKVTGVFRPATTPSHINSRFFLSMNGGGMEGAIKQQANDFATNNFFYTYLLLRPGSDPKQVEAKFPAFLDKYAAKDLKAIGFDKRQFLTAVKDIHLRSIATGNISPGGSLIYLYILGSVALFTLLIACINFMNLATARSAKRSSEVGVRKVLGAERRFLIGQFLGESVLMSLIAFVLALGLATLMLPAFGMMTHTSLKVSFPDDLPLISSFLALAVLTGIVAGIYPAFYLSSFKPALVLKGRFSNSLAAVSLRKGLVVFQFIISVVLIICTAVIADQMRYLRSTDLGFEKNGQIIIPLRSETAKNNFPALKNEFARNPAVASVGACNYNPGGGNLSDNLFYRQGQSMKDAKVTRMNYVDFGYMRTLGLNLEAGRLFSEEFQADTNNRIILNEKAIQTIGFPSAKQAIGQKVFFDFKGQNYAFEIVGVIKDFHYEDLHLPITPYGYRLNTQPLNFNYMMVRAKAGSPVAGLLPSMEKTWHSLDPNEPFGFSFLDADFQKNYEADERLSAMINFFTVLAILISCLGLFGLASFSAEQRIREIGIRKVLGASVTGIVFLLSRDFLKLVAIGALIASPLAWYVMHRWLGDFAYRTSINPTVFVLTFAVALFIALFTISFQAIRAALANPARSIKTE